MNDTHYPLMLAIKYNRCNVWKTPVPATKPPVYQGTKFPLDQLMDARRDLMIQSFQAFGQSQRIDHTGWLFLLVRPKN